MDTAQKGGGRRKPCLALSLFCPTNAMYLILSLCAGRVGLMHLKCFSLFLVCSRSRKFSWLRCLSVDELRALIGHSCDVEVFNVVGHVDQ